MNAIRARIRALTRRRRWAGLTDIRVVIRELNPVPRLLPSGFTVVRSGAVAALLRTLDTYSATFGTAVCFVLSKISTH
jgi:hypothetical protein